MRKLTQANREEVVSLYTSGLSSGQIAAKFGCSPANIQILLRRRGVTMRPPKGQNNGFYRGGSRAEKSARQAVYRAIRDGKLKKQPCERCGVSTTVRAHHDDYAERLKVRWLCQKHHHQWHRDHEAKGVGGE